jgi:hypothetical protein
MADKDDAAIAIDGAEFGEDLIRRRLRGFAEHAYPRADFMRRGKPDEVFS